MDELDELMAIEEHWPVALEARDRAWLLAHTTEQFLCIQPDGVLGRDAYLDHRVVDNDTIVDGRNVVVRGEVRGETGVIVNRAHFLTESDDGRRREIRIIGSGFYVREGETWKVAVMHLTEVPISAEHWGDPLIDIPS